MTTTNKTNKTMTAKEIMGMTVKVNDKVTNLVKFVSDDKVYIDDSVNVASDYAFPKTAIGENFHPTYYACALNVTLAKDVKNVTTGDKETRKAENQKIMDNAVGFKAVCRDLTTLAGKTEKGFLKMTASLPCDVKVNPNGCITGLWVFTSKILRDDFLRMVRNGINDGKYHVYTGEKKTKKQSKTVLRIAKMFGITYEQAYEKWQNADK